MWSNNMVFRCIYRCPEEKIPYAELETHIKSTCPYRPRFCANNCGNYRLHDPDQKSESQPYTCEKCFLQSVPQQVKLTGKLGSKF